jgi:hypothetical protein
VHMQRIETDYLIIGSGAVGMAFADSLVQHSTDRIVFVDRHHAPGGHWNDAYSFVRLHQPSGFYGVNSRELGGNGRDTNPLNQGMCERASAAEILSYYDAVMQDFLASGRVQYFPMCNFEDASAKAEVQRFTSLLSNARTEVVVHKKIVDTRYLNTAVPSTHKPKYAIGEGVHAMPLNDLPKLKAAASSYVVVGAGKTGIDACLWLLDNQVPHQQIVWVIPRDSWFLNRINIQPGDEFFAGTFGAMATQMEAIIAADSVGDLFKRLEASEQLLRLDVSVEPQMYHAAVVSKAELAELRNIKRVVRMGRVKSITTSGMQLERGEYALDADALYIDCSASAAEARPGIPIFQGKWITPQFIRAFQPTFSAALTAYVETLYPDDELKNTLCGVVPLPDTPMSWLTMQAASMKNQYAWSRDKRIAAFNASSRLDGFTAMLGRLQEEETEKVAAYERFVAAMVPAAKKLPSLIASAT